MVQHRLDPEPGTVTDFLSPDRRSVLSVAPGETVVVRTLDAHDYLDRQRTPGETRPLMFPDRRGHCLAGLIAVHGA